MELTAEIVGFLLGLLLVVKGGDLFVEASVAAARALRVPPFVIGATLVSLATTLPELLVSLFACLQGRTELAVGNAVGSVTANTGLILALALIALPGLSAGKDLFLKSFLLLGAAAALWLLGRQGYLTGAGCLVLLACLALFLAGSLLAARKSRTLRPAEEKTGLPLGHLLFFLLGGGCILSGAQLLVNAGASLAGRLGVPESVVGATILAVGTSLPELVTSLAAILKKQNALSAGNILGANLIDTTLILPVCWLSGGGSLPLGSQCLGLDLPFCLVILAAAFLPPLFTRRFARWQGFACLGLYLCYLGLMMG